MSKALCLPAVAWCGDGGVKDLRWNEERGSGRAMGRAGMRGGEAAGAAWSGRAASAGGWAYVRAQSYRDSFRKHGWRMGESRQRRWTWSVRARAEP